MPPADEPIYFLITGFPKSGNKWFHKMVCDFDSVGGYSRDLDRGLPLLGRPYLENRRLLEVLAGEGATIEAFTKKLLNPAADVPLHLSAPGRRAVEPILSELAVEASKIAKTPVPLTRLMHLVGEPPATPFLEASAYGTAGMHVPIRHAQSILPSFRILHLTRDPRDVVVSWFYHLVATMNPELAHSFVSWDERTERIAMRPDWKQRFADRFLRRVRRFFTGPAIEPRHVFVIRYEDLLDRCIDELRRVLGILGCDEPPQRIEEVVAERSFEAMTGGTNEQRHSMTRKGKAGDWSNYFDRDLLDALGPTFLALVRDLGYEPDDAWAGQVPTTAPCELEFSRFRVRRSTVRSFIRYWEQSEDLQERYPNPYDTRDGATFYGWLCRCPHADVQQWLALARALHEFWNVDIEEPVEAVES